MSFTGSGDTCLGYLNLVACVGWTIKGISIMAETSYNKPISHFISGSRGTGKCGELQWEMCTAVTRGETSESPLKCVMADQTGTGLNWYF